MSSLQTIAEKNARTKARGVYYRWLVQQYGSIALVEFANDADPISLRQIFVPLRVDKKDIADENMPAPNKFKDETEQNQLGSDAFTAVLGNAFLVLSGRPGAGKTTFMKALINELCGTHVSDFRQQAHQQLGNVFPIPIILRELSELENITSIDDLISAWWQKQTQLNHLHRKRHHNAERLDIKRLQVSLQQDQLQPLLLLDGIDEVGSLELRARLLTFAREAAQTYRIIITGRPSGLADLQQIQTLSAQESWLYILPFTRPQIETFIHKWYDLRPEWLSQREQGIQRFLDAMHDNNRPHLLSLARRAIFLSLMALVHCTRNEMPHGRAALYAAIIDLYLERQQKHRRLQTGTDGQALPQWSSKEPRIALGYLAWRSMQIGTKEKDANKKADNRRIIWQKQALLEELRQLLSTTKYARFRELTEKDAKDLLAFYLHPAGLLVEPAEEQIQFAHLSFQEYLCAEYLQGRMTGMRVEHEFADKIQTPLAKSGWDEVALLLLAIHAENTQNMGHFELLSLLDIAQPAEARLLFLALLAQELPIDQSERQNWLPILIMSALIHPELKEIERLQNYTELEQAGLEWLCRLLPERGAKQQWALLVSAVKDNLPVGLQDWQLEENWQHNAKQRWLTTADDDTWCAKLGTREGQDHALLILLLRSRWGLHSQWVQQDNNQNLNPVKYKPLQQALEAFNHTKPCLWQLSQWNTKEQELYFSSITKQQQWQISPTAFALTSLNNVNSLLTQQLQQQMPLSLWLQQGDSIEIDYLSLNSLIIVPFSLYYPQNLVIRCRLSIALYQWQQYLEHSITGKMFEDLSLSLSLSLLKRSFQQQSSWLQSQSLSNSQLFYLLDLDLQLPQLTLRSRARVFSRSTFLAVLDSRSSLLSLSLSSTEWFEKDIPLLAKISKVLDKKNLSEDDLKNFYFAYFRYITNWAAHDWFAEQVEQPDLVKARGGKPAEPLPKALDLFDDQGMPLTIQKRANLVKLQQWANNDDNWLNFVFPDGLSAADEKLLRDDLAELKQHDWSPYGFMEAVLADWPEDQPEQDWSIDSAEQAMIKEGEALLARHKQE